MKSLREEHAQSTRNAILEAARQTFTSKGYDAASIDEIAAAARVTSGALYHHFRNKREVMQAVFEALEAALKDRVATAIVRAKSPSQAVRLALRACKTTFVRSFSSRRRACLAGRSGGGLMRSTGLD